MTHLCWIAFALSISWAQEAATRGAQRFDSSNEEAVVHGYAARHALVVGIDQYQDAGFPDLSYAVKDARAIASMLIDRYGFDPERVTLIEDEAATKVGLELALEDALVDAQHIGADDLVVVFFAGHGVTQTTPLGKRGHLAPSDARRKPDGNYVWSSLYGMRDLEDVSEAIPAKHVLFVLDCCFSGLVAQRNAPVVAAGLGQRARQVITAGNGEQTVLDGGGDGHSVFTTAVLEALRGAADGNGDDVITFGELYGFVGTAVEDATASRQTPLQHSLPDHRGGNVALIPPGERATVMSVTEELASLRSTKAQLTEEVLGYKDALLIRELLNEAKSELWPRRSKNVPRYRQWLAEAGPLLDRRATHHQSLAGIEQQAQLEIVVAGLAQTAEAAELDWKAIDPVLRFRFERLTELVELCADLERTIEDIRSRLAFAEQCRANTIDAYPDEWDEAINEIAFSDPYDGFELEPIEGLVPIGPDPASGLWEFWHVETGTRPPRDPQTGRLECDEETGLVLVLLPGAETTMGSQADDPDAAFYDPDRDRGERLRDVVLDPFLLSKYEMTQGQWLRITGVNPSRLRPGNTLGYPATTLAHPVETVSWYACLDVLARVGLVLPTEARWEYGARGGTTTPWWTGRGAESIAGAANIADQRLGRGSTIQRYETWLDDGHEIHAPVGLFRLNAFGLHDVIGNVWEWCLDGSQLTAAAPGRPEIRIGRGGSCFHIAKLARSANAANNAPDLQVENLGVRPAFDVGGESR